MKINYFLFTNKMQNLSLNNLIERFTPPTTEPVDPTDVTVRKTENVSSTKKIGMLVTILGVYFAYVYVIYKFIMSWSTLDTTARLICIALILPNNPIGPIGWAAVLIFLWAREADLIPQSMAVPDVTPVVSEASASDSSPVGFQFY